MELVTPSFRFAIAHLVIPGGVVRLHLPNVGFREPLPIRQHSWQVIREVAHVAG
jgi:hypothetical protein